MKVWAFSFAALVVHFDSAAATVVDGTASFLNGAIVITSGNAGTPVPLTITQTDAAFTGKMLDVVSATPESVASVSTAGAVLKKTGTFDIPHPLRSDPRQRLQHSFVEAPLVDNIYTGE